MALPVGSKVNNSLAIGQNLLLCVVRNRPMWLIVVICQINSLRSRFWETRLHVNFFVVCKTSYRWGRLSGCFLHVFHVIEFLIEYWQWRQYSLIVSLNKVMWSNSFDCIRARSAKFALQGTGNVCWIGPFLWSRGIASLSRVWDVSRCYQFANSYYSGSTRANVFRTKMTLR